MNSVQAKCSFCDKAKGGSLASEAVVSLVSCDTFAQMAAASTNLAGGAPYRKSNRKAGARPSLWSGRRAHKGGDCTPPSTRSALDSYTLGVASVPSGTPAANDGAINFNNVQGSVLASLAAEPPVLGSGYQSVYFPDNFVDNNISVTTNMSGGSSISCGMCGGVV